MVSDRDLRYYSNYYGIINKFLLMKVSVETCFCIPEKLEGECFENIDEKTLTELKQIAEDLYDDIKELTKLNQYEKDINGIILKKYSFLDSGVLSKIISNWFRCYYL